MRKTEIFSSFDFSGNLRLLLVAAGCTLIAFTWLIRNTDGGAFSRLAAAAAVALAPLVLAWPRLFQGFGRRRPLPMADQMFPIADRPAPRAPDAPASGSWRELSRLRKAGAI